MPTPTARRKLEEIMRTESLARLMQIEGFDEWKDSRLAYTLGDMDANQTGRVFGDVIESSDEWKDFYLDAHERGLNNIIEDFVCGFADSAEAAWKASPKPAEEAVFLMMALIQAARLNCLR